LYTTTSQHSYERFKSNPTLFQQYHEGFRTQVRQWPVNPLDLTIRWIVKLEKKKRGAPTSQNKSKGNDLSLQKKINKIVIADFGCGDGVLAEKLFKVNVPTLFSAPSKKEKKGSSSVLTVKEKLVCQKNCPFIVHSFDLVSNGNSLITPCDMANVPLGDKSVDVGVFCLALMGTNIAEFIREAHRILRDNGVIKIAEVRSRFEKSASDNESKSPTVTKRSKTQQKSGKNILDTTGEVNHTRDTKLLDHFITVMMQLGFKKITIDQSNKMFFMMEFRKIQGKKPSKTATFTAKPCIYKRR